MPLLHGGSRSTGDRFGDDTTATSPPRLGSCSPASSSFSCSSSAFTPGLAACDPAAPAGTSHASSPSTFLLLTTGTPAVPLDPSPGALVGRGADNGTAEDPALPPALL